MSATYALTLRATNSDRDSIHALRAVLKLAKRRGLLAVEVRELPSINTQTISRHDAKRQIVTITQRRNEKTTMTINLRKYGPTNKWLRLEDFHGRPPRQERVGLVKVENGKYGERVVLVLEPSGQMLSLNQTSTGNLLRDLGSTDDEWIGKLVEIYAGEVETKSGRTDAILVRGVTDAPVDAAIAANATKVKSSDMDDEIPF
jgi:hypothetical protein